MLAMHEIILLPEKKTLKPMLQLIQFHAFVVQWNEKIKVGTNIITASISSHSNFISNYKVTLHWVVVVWYNL